MNDVRRFVSRRAPLVLALASSVMMLACGGGQTTGGTTPTDGPPTVPDDLLSLVPANPAIVARVDVAAVRGSPYWATLSGWIGALAGRLDGPGDDLTRLLERTDQLVFATYDSEGGDDVLILARGSFQPGELERVFRAAAAEAGETVRDKNIGGFALLGTTTIVGGHLDTRTWITAPLARARAAIAAGAGTAPALRTGATYRTLAAEIGFEGGAAAFMAEMTPMLRAEVAQTAEHGGDEGRIATLLLGFTRGAGRLELRDGISASAIGDASSPEAAAIAAEFVRSTAQEFGSSIPAMMLGVAPVLQRVEARAQGTRATGSVRATDAEVRTILGRLDGFIRIALEGDGGKCDAVTPAAVSASAAAPAPAP